MIFCCRWTSALFVMANGHSHSGSHPVIPRPQEPDHDLLLSIVQGNFTVATVDL